jgi:hypothetical protein
MELSPVVLSLLFSIEDMDSLKDMEGSSVLIGSGVGSNDDS